MPVFKGKVHWSSMVCQMKHPMFEGLDMPTYNVVHQLEYSYAQRYGRDVKWSTCMFKGLDVHCLPVRYEFKFWNIWAILVDVLPMTINDSFRHQWELNVGHLIGWELSQRDKGKTSIYLLLKVPLIICSPLSVCLSVLLCLSVCLSLNTNFARGHCPSTM